MLSGIAISRLGFDDAIRRCRANDEGGGVCFVNVHTLTEAQRDAPLRDALVDAKYCFADGVPLLWLARAVRAPIGSRVCGPDFMAEMLRREAHELHGFIGGAPGQATAIAQRYRVRSICHSPPMRGFSTRAALEDWECFLDRCPGGRPPRFVWVGLGAPKQEHWIATIARRAPTTTFFGVGAAFDFLSQTKRRAPRVLQGLGLEWAYRLGSEPRRLWRRYLVANTRFAVLAVNELRRSLTASPRT